MKFPFPFPSPLGASYFQIINITDVASYLIVSVPSRGILFPNMLCNYIKSVENEEFPSPLGASYFQIITCVMILKCLKLFPSPLGASYFQIRQGKSTIDILDLLSFRPLSGHLISKSVTRIGYCKCGYSFRPLSGHLISKLKNENISKRNQKGFPSPLGASYFQIR